MATLIQKDVLLEYVASSIAAANKSNKLDILESLKEFREYLYKTNCKDINYTDSIAKITQLSGENL